MALELAAHGVTVNAVAPGKIATAMTGNEDVDPYTVERSGIPAGRPGDAREVAAVVALLAGPAGAYVTGASWVVDGGMLLMGPVAGHHLQSDEWRSACRRDVRGSDPPVPAGWARLSVSRRLSLLSSGQKWSMTTVTAHDIRVLAQSGAEEPVLLLVDGQVRVVPADEVDLDTSGEVIYTRAELVAELGEDITDVEAEILAAGLTARLA